MYAHDIAVIATPIGMVHVRGTDRYLTSVVIKPDGGCERDAVGGPARAAAEQLREYLAGERTTFDLPLELPRTPRGAALRAAMCAIGFGETSSYGALSAAIGSSPRAVGQACARNPFPIIVPCHRVLSASGPERYSAGEGPRTKLWLLEHERRFAVASRKSRP